MGALDGSSFSGCDGLDAIWNYIIRISLFLCVYIYIYIYREREREREYLRMRLRPKSESGSRCTVNDTRDIRDDDGDVGIVAWGGNRSR